MPAVQWKHEDEVNGTPIGPLWFTFAAEYEARDLTLTLEPTGWVAKPTAVALAKELNVRFEEL